MITQSPIYVFKLLVIQFITLDKEKKKIPSISYLELGKMTLKDSSII